MTSAGSEGGRPAALRVDHLSKTFPGTRALQDVTLDVAPGEVHALLGGNGSGKSTLIKILAGVYHADPGGTIELGGVATPVERWSSEAAKQAGLHFVHQNPGVFLDLTVAENLAIGRGFPRGPLGTIRWKQMHRRTEELLERFHIKALPQLPVGALRPADRTMVAIARALQDQEDASEGVLVLDEPTTALPSQEVDLLLDKLRQYAAGGQTIIYVTHRLNEVLEIADRISVLRDGRHVGTVPAEGMDEAKLVEFIVGRALDNVFPPMPEVKDDERALEVRHLSGGPLSDVNLTLRRGEVLGIAGLLGSGRTELLRMLFGAYPVRDGEILLDGAPTRFSSPADAMRAGVAYVPEDRAADAAFLDMTVRENVTAGQIGAYFRTGFLRHGEERKAARSSIFEFMVKTPSDTVPLATLSGGNQQKVILARWLRRKPRLLLLDEPTQGVDVNARAEIYTLVREAVQAGASVLLVTSDFEELARVADRAVVLGEGRVVAEVPADQLDAARLTELAYLSTEVPA